MQPLKHGYTNATVGDGTTVEKTYCGPEAELRLEQEHGVLTAIRGLLPVPPVLRASRGTLVLGFVGGEHGQDLLEAGRAAEVLAACGRVLRQIHAIAPQELGIGTAAPGQVLVHGDFGPNNVLLDPATLAVTAVLDWEFAGIGDPALDLAWCEWIVRAHHPQHVSALPAFFAAYGAPVPDWPTRRALMAARCRELAEFCERWTPGGDGVRRWRERATQTAAWAE